MNFLNRLIKAILLLGYLGGIFYCPDLDKVIVSDEENDCGLINKIVLSISGLQTNSESDHHDSDPVKHTCHCPCHITSYLLQSQSVVFCTVKIKQQISSENLSDLRSDSVYRPPKIA